MVCPGQQPTEPSLQPGLCLPDMGLSSGTPRTTPELSAHSAPSLYGEARLGLGCAITIPFAKAGKDVAPQLQRRS